MSAEHLRAGERETAPREDRERVPEAAPPARYGDLTPQGVLALHRSIGNAAVGRLLRQPTAAPPLASSYTKAADMAGYIYLVRELEKQFPDKNSLDMLAMLRQAYYGKPWSVDTTPQWSDVIPVGGNPGNPTSRIGSGPGSLFEALKASQEVAGTDMGHVFAGLQAFFHQTTDVALTQEILGQSVIVRTVNMPNTEFATWGGDVGAAAARPVLNDELGRPVMSDADCFKAEASDQDLEGDLDAYAMVTGGGGARGLESMLQAPGTTAPGTPVSQVIYEYFLGNARLAGARTTKHRDFATSIGGVVSGNRITNRAAVAAAISPRVADFADMFFWGKYKGAKGTAATAAYMLYGGAAVTLAIVRKTLVMVDLFLDWIEARL